MGFVPFLKLFDFSRKFSPILLVNCLIAKPGYGNLLCFSGQELLSLSLSLFAEERFELRKVKFLNFDRFLVTVWLLLETTLSNLR